MIREWLVFDGTIKRFDTNTRTVTVVNQEGEVLVPVRPATPDDLAEYASVFPDSSQEEINAKSAITAELMALLVQLRNVTADGVIVPQEFAALNAPVQNTLRNYSAFPYEDNKIDKLAFLVVTQISYAYSLMLTQAAARQQQVLESIISISAKLDEIEVRLTALEG
jgi:hypothetical protein